MTDVTAQYIPNAGFEACEVLPTKVVHDNQKNVDVNVVELYQESSVAKGYDYEAQGWKLVEQQTAVNAGVIAYGCNVQTGKWTPVGEPGPAQGITGSKGLCFVGNKGLVYQQAQEITLPAGVYRLTVNLYARNGQTTNPGPTQQVVNIKTGFMPTGGTEDNLIPAKRQSFQFASNAWDTDVLDIELTQPATGRFQISYGTSYYVVVDDVKLEYQGGVVTTALAAVITKAQTLNEELNNSSLADAIAAAQNFMENPTAQEDVEAQVETLYTAMATALAATTVPVNITAAYLENASFETGKIAPWEWGSKAGTVGEPVNENSVPFIDGKNVVEFATSGSNSLSQTLSHMPAGYYLVEARLNQNASLKLGSATTACTGGRDALFLRTHSVVQQSSGGLLAVGIQGTASYRVDAFRLFYGQDEASLLAAVLPAVVSDAQALLNNAAFNNVTGEERSELQAAVNGTDAKAINAAMNEFYVAKDAYDGLKKAKANAVSFTAENYPYATAATLQLIQTVLNTEAVTRVQATEMTTQLTNACSSAVTENAYCEGVSHTDYSQKIVAANASGSTPDKAWTVNNMTIRTLTNTKAWVTRDNAKDKVVYGTAEAYSSANTSLVASMQQTVNSLPAGTYVLSVVMMAKKDMPVSLRVNNAKVATFIGTGTVTSTNWEEVVCSFTKTDDGDLTLRLEESSDMTYKEWYADNFRLYRLEIGTEGIQQVTNTQQMDEVVYDLQGRRVITLPKKGVFIVNGKKMVVK